MEAKEKDASNAAIAKMYTADLAMLNKSGVSGTAELTLMEDQLTVKIEATGLEPNMPHPQHIHGFMDNKRNSNCPTSSADTNGDDIVDLGEGAPFYGPVLLPLYIPVDEFPVADANGVLIFERTFTLGETEFEEEGEVISSSELSPLQNRAIVLHGMTVDGDILQRCQWSVGRLSPARVTINKIKLGAFLRTLNQSLGVLLRFFLVSIIYINCSNSFS